MKQSILYTANGKQKADLVLKNASIVNVFTETIELGDIAITDGIIAGIGHYEGKEERDMTGYYVCPGFIDGHIHLESSMVIPTEFEKAVMPHGTTTVITDPHEIANVAGCHGIDFMMQYAQAMQLDVYFMIPSCVPSTDLDEAGARLTAQDIAPYYENPRVLGLAEMMNAFGVNEADPAVLEKIQCTLDHQRIIDGHAPLLTDKALNGYIAAGIRSDHECSTLEEAREKLSLGQWIMIREGTAAQNLQSLIPLFDAPYNQRIMLVTDDKHPFDLLEEGHIDAIIRKAIQAGVSPIAAIKAGTWNSANYFGLHHLGAIAPGYQADLAILDDLTHCHVTDVYKKGVLCAQNQHMVTQSPTPVIDPKIEAQVKHSFHTTPITPAQLAFHDIGTKLRVIQLHPKELLTSQRIVDCTSADAQNPSPYATGVNITEDIIKIVAIERHKNTSHIGKGFLGGYGLQRGAVATSIGHDSHNLVVTGTNDTDIACAANAVIATEGGLAIALDGEIVASLALPVAGIMSDAPLATVNTTLEHMKQILYDWGIPKDIDPFMTLSFVSLPVIPALRLNTYGIIDVNAHKIVSPFYDEEPKA